MKPTLVTLLCAPTGNKLPHRGGRRRKYAYDSLTLEDWATMNNRDIAHRLGAPMHAVEKWRSRHNLPPAPRNKNRQTHDYSNLTLEDWATKSNGEIAKQIGKSRTAVQIYRSRYGLPPSPIGKGRTARPPSDSNVFAVLTDYRGLPLSRDDLVDETGLSRDGVRYQLEQLLRAGLVTSRPNPDYPSSMLYALRVKTEEAA